MLKKIKTYLENLWRRWNDPTKALQKEYGKLLLEARNLQRGGDIPAFARKTAEAEEIRKKIEELKG